MAVVSATNVLSDDSSDFLLFKISCRRNKVILSCTSRILSDAEELVSGFRQRPRKSQLISGQ